MITNDELWYDAIGLPTAAECRLFNLKANEFLRKRGEYVGSMTNNNFFFGKKSVRIIHDEDLDSD